MKTHSVSSTIMYWYFNCVNKCKIFQHFFKYLLKDNSYKSLFFFASIAPLLAGYYEMQSFQIRSVREFGAKGDGKTDDYSALMQAAKWLCSSSNRQLIFPAGNYLIDRYRITGGKFQNNVQNIQFNNCNQVQIIGHQARITVQGKFHRSADIDRGKYSESYSAGVIPFEFLNSSNFLISGFELNGNANQTTRDLNVAESSNAGIQTTNCKHYRIEEISVHHFSTDGITLGANSVKADRYATLRNVELRNNARQGLSVIQLRGGHFLNSKFHNNGRTEGQYGYHLPAAGVDVEPVRASPPEDIQTGELVFEKCQFYDNIGSQFISVWPEKVDSITVRSSMIRATRDDSDPVSFVNSAATSLTEDNQFIFEKKHGISLAMLRTSGFSFLKQLIYRNNRFQIDHHLSIYSPESRLLPIEFNRNEIVIQNINDLGQPIWMKGMKEVKGNTFSVQNNPGKSISILNDQVIIRYSNISSLRDNAYQFHKDGVQMKIQYDGVSRDGEKYEGVRAVFR